MPVQGATAARTLVVFLLGGVERHFVFLGSDGELEGHLIAVVWVQVSCKSQTESAPLAGYLFCECFEQSQSFLRRTGDIQDISVFSEEGRRGSEHPDQLHCFVGSDVDAWEGELDSGHGFTECKVELLHGSLFEIVLSNEFM